MTPTILLALALCGGAPVPDHVFLEAQEHWVIDTLPEGRGGRTLEAIADRRTAALVRMLGCPRSDCRELAEEELGWLGLAAWRPLVWATRHRDPEVRHRARRLLDDLAYCPACRGTGLGAFLYDVPDVHEQVVRFYFRACPDCGGTGLRR